MKFDQGAAAEHFVCYDLLMRGYRASMTAAQSPYDITLDMGGRLIRVQVKSTLRGLVSQTSKTYKFLVGTAGPGKKLKPADMESCEVYAFVVLEPTPKIAYMLAAEVAGKSYLQFHNERDDEEGPEQAGLFFNEWDFDDLEGLPHKEPEPFHVSDEIGDDGFETEGARNRRIAAETKHLAKYGQLPCATAAELKPLRQPDRLERIAWS